METLANLLMVLVAAVLVGYPFWFKKKKGNGFSRSIDDQVDRRELLFSALGEIEFDYRMKKLSDFDYQELKAGYQKQALAVLDKEDEMLDKELDKELAKIKNTKSRG